MTKLKMSALIALIALFAVASAALANPNRYKPGISDADFSYYQDEEDDSRTQTGFVTITLEDGKLVVHLTDEASPNSLIHVFSAIRPLDEEREAELFPVAVYGNANAQSVAADQAREQSRVRALAGMAAKRDGWTIQHGEISLDTTIDAYAQWFAAAGLSLTADPANTHANVRPFDLSGLDRDMRVVFTRNGDGVRVFIGRL